MADMRYMDQLVPVVGEAVALLQSKSLTYGDSWKKRGGAGAWFTVVRPWDRLEKIVGRHGGDIFAAVAADPTGADGSALACVRDVMNYMILVEAECRVNHGALPHSQEGERTLPPPFLELTGEMAIPETEGTLEVHGDASVMLADLIPPPGTPEDGGHYARQAPDEAVEDAGEFTQDAEGAGEPPVAPASPDDRLKALQARIAEAARDLGYDVDEGTFLPVEVGGKDVEFRVRVSV